MWLYDRLCESRFPNDISYKKLLRYLHDIPFEYSLEMDENRADDGIRLRRRFALYLGWEKDLRIVTDALHGPCSVLEMMAALAIRCEEDIMDDPQIGDRTGQWFWGMIRNLGIGSMSDDRFDEQRVSDAVTRLLNRDYESNGEGGLFTVRHHPQDLRDVEIWRQMLWYLDTI